MLTVHRKRVKKATKDRAITLYDKTGTTATLPSFLGYMVLLGLQVKKLIYKQEKTAVLTAANEIEDIFEKRREKTSSE